MNLSWLHMAALSHLGRKSVGHNPALAAGWQHDITQPGRVSSHNPVLEGAEKPSTIPRHFTARCTELDGSFTHCLHCTKRWMAWQMNIGKIAPLYKESSAWTECSIWKGRRVLNQAGELTEAHLFSELSNVSWTLAWSACLTKGKMGSFAIKGIRRRW